MARDPDLVWIGPVFDPSGYADEARGLLCALDALGVRVALRPVHRLAPGFREGLEPAERRVLDHQVATELPGRQLLVQHHTADAYFQLVGDVHHIGRTMFETDGIPPSWVRHANRMDELWLPSQFNIETFRRAGVHVPLIQVPGGINSDAYCPEGPVMSLPGLRGTVFLAVFEWRLRKGWDVLLRAWAHAFSPADDVTLVLRTYPVDKVSGSDNRSTIEANIDRFLRDSCGLSRKDVAPIMVLGDTVPAAQMPSLYRLASALVAPTRGEGWGRPFMEAMATGVPVIATNWSAHLEFMHDDNSLLLAIEGLEDADGVEMPLYAGQRWAAPSVPHLVTLLRQVYEDPGTARALGERARTEMRECWPWRRAATVMAERVAVITEERLGRESTPRPMALVPNEPSLAIEAALFDPSARSHECERVVAALCLAWSGTVRVSSSAVAPRRPALTSDTLPAWHALVADHAGRASRAPSVNGAGASTIALTWLDTSTLTTLHRLSASHWVVHTGDVVGRSVPGHIVQALRDHADDVWVPDAMAYAACLAAGVAAERLWLVPPVPFETHVTPYGAVHAFARRTESLFLLPVLEAEQLSAAEALVRVWQRTFTPHDAARLVLYVPNAEDRAITAWRERVLMQLASGRLLSGAPVELVREALPADDLAALVRTVQVLLDPTGAARLHAERRLAEHFGRVVLVGVPPGEVVASPGTLDDASLSGYVPVPLAAGGLPVAAAWRTALRAAADPAYRAAYADAAVGAAPSLRDLADTAVARLGGRSQAPRRAQSLVTEATLPWPLHEARGTTVLAHPDWGSGEGGGIVRSFMSACDVQDDCSLVLCLDPTQGLTVDDVVRIVRDAMASAGRTAATAPDIVLVPDPIADPLLSALLRRCDAVVALTDTPLGAAARAAGKPVVTSLAPTGWHVLAGVRGTA